MATPFDELSPIQKVQFFLFMETPPKPEEAIRTLRQSLIKAGGDIIYSNLVDLIKRNKGEIPPERDKEIAAACEKVLKYIETFDRRN